MFTDRFKATFSKDLRLDFSHDDFGQFQKMAWLAITHLGWEGWSFEGDGVELDPVEDLGIPENIKLRKRRNA